MPTSGAASESARRLVVERDLVRAAFEHLTVDAFMTLPFEALGPTKALLKRFFSLQPWAPEDDDALAAAVGPGEGAWRRVLDADLTLDYGWTDGRFGLEVLSTASAAEVAAATTAVDSLADTFDGPVVPEATPNPRTIRFQVGPIHSGPSRWYESASAAADDPSASRLFAGFDQVANVLVGPTSWPSACAGPATGSDCCGRCWRWSPRSSPRPRAAATPGLGWRWVGRPARGLSAEG